VDRWRPGKGIGTGGKQHQELLSELRRSEAKSRIEARLDAFSLIAQLQGRYIQLFTELNKLHLLAKQCMFIVLF
jgi:hypothetical protein